MNLTGLWRIAGKEVNYAHCPICGHSGWKLYVNRSTGAWHCFARRHSYPRGGVVDISGMPWRGSGAAAELDKAQPRELELPILGKLVNNTQAMGYLAQRHITQDTARTLGLADWVAQRRIFIPFGGENGDIIGFTGRDYSGLSALKYRNSPGPKPLYVPDLVAGTGTKADKRPCVVVEGPFDALAIYQAGRDYCRVAAIGGKTASSFARTELLRFCGGRQVLLWLDTDALGDASLLARQLAPHVAGVRIFGTKLAKDAADIAPPELAQILLRATA